jgi:hypothetical protein
MKKTYLFLLLCICIFSSLFAKTEVMYFITMRKAGTHLLEKYLRLLTTKTDEEYRKLNNSIENRYVRSVSGKNLQIRFKHLCDNNLNMHQIAAEIKKILLIRDPRDVLLSSIYFIPKMPKSSKDLDALRFIKSWAPLSLEDKITSMITQQPPEEIENYLSWTCKKKQILFPCMYVFVGQFPLALKWLEQPNTLLIRFEDLVGPMGGGSKEAQYLAMQRIADFIGYPFDEEVYNKISADLFGKSRTFRSGKIGGWKEAFTEEHKELFKERYSQILDGLGYEQDNNW